MARATPRGTPNDRSPAVHTVELAKHYRRTVALRGLSMTVERGEIFGFLGPNGAGKTTTVKLLLGLARPTGGEALVLGAPAGDVEARRRVGYLPELFRFQHWLTAREVLYFHGRLLRMERTRIERAARETLATVGLADRADDKVGGFSKGMQQRLGLAVALFGEPELVVLDEPTSALDPVGRHDVRAIVRGLRARGATVFLNTHLLEEAEQVCDRVTVIDRGRAIATGSLEELLGTRTTVRLKVAGLAEGWWRSLPADSGGTVARWTSEGTWLRVDGLPAARVPDLVALAIAQGGRVEAVVPEHQTLEERFLELLGAGAAGRPTGHATVESTTQPTVQSIRPTNLDGRDVTAGLMASPEPRPEPSPEFTPTPTLTTTTPTSTPSSPANHADRSGSEGPA